MVRARSILCTLVVANLAVCRVANADFAELVRRVPADANAVVLIDCQRLFASPIAVRDGWKKKYQADFAQRPFLIPPQAKNVIRAGSVDLHSGRHPWELALLDLDHAPDLDKIANREKGYVDKVANTKAVWSPRGAYAVATGTNGLALLFPPNRQFLARWLKQPSGKIAPYLLDATESMSQVEAQVLLAIDLDDAVDHDMAIKMLKTVASAGSAGNVEAQAAALASLRGARFEIILKDKAWGRLSLDFGADPAPLVPVAHKLIEETLNRYGAALDELSTWKVETRGKTLALHGQLDTSGLLRLGSLLELPQIGLDNSDEEVDASNPMLYATQSHFKAVTSLLGDLTGKKREAKTYGQMATWVEQYAKRIDRLPLVHVDPDMQQYSAGVADDLRQMVSSMRGAGVRGGMQTAGLDSTSSYGWGNYDGYFGTREVENQRRSIRAQERGTSMLDAGKLADLIRNDTTKIRRQMTERYKVEF
jgi:hypothetical protein